MHNDFEIQWERRRAASSNDRCPLNEAQWQAMVERAMQQELPARVQRPLWRRVAHVATAAAACVALVVLGIGQLRASERPAMVDFGGQSVRFICNNRCDAQRTIGYFDSYIGKNHAR